MALCQEARRAQHPPHDDWPPPTAHRRASIYWQQPQTAKHSLRRPLPSHWVCVLPLPPRPRPAPSRSRNKVNIRTPSWVPNKYRPTSSECPFDLHAYAALSPARVAWGNNKVETRRKHRQTIWPVPRLLSKSVAAVPRECSRKPQNLTPPLTAAPTLH